MLCDILAFAIFFNKVLFDYFQMAEAKRGKVHSIPFIVDGVVRIVKSVSKHTRCNDVIDKLPNLTSPLAVYISVDGEMKQLPGKAKLLKVWRVNGPARKVEFVIKKAESVTKKKKVDTRRLFGDRKRREKQEVKSSQVKSRLSKDTLKQVSDLAFYVRYQKLKVSKLARQSIETSQSTPQTKLMSRMTSHASTNSMDAFLDNADLDAMAKFLSFCGHVTTEKLKGKLKKTEGDYEDSANSNDSLEHASYGDDRRSFTDRTIVDKSAIFSNLKSTKLGLKQKFTSHHTEEKRTSTSTIGSTDTGYQSVETASQTGSHVDSYAKSQTICAEKSKRPHLLHLDDSYEFRRHSTPVQTRQRKRSADTLDCTITQEKLHLLDDNQLNGKSLIFEKFMTNQSIPAFQLDTETGDHVTGYPYPKRQCLERNSGSVYSSQVSLDRCRFLWNKYCDSDSDTDSEAAEDVTHDNLDTAFITSEQSQTRKLRRESAISNLNRFSLRQSLPTTRISTISTTDDFNYSFDCSFPRMDESQSVNFTVDYSFSDSEASSRDCDGFTKKRSHDDSMDSFMNTYIEDPLHDKLIECSF